MPIGSTAEVEIDIVADLNDTFTQLNRVKDKLSGMDQPAQTASKGVKNLVGSLSRVAAPVAAIAAVGAAIIGVGKAAWGAMQSVNQFSDAMSQVSAVAGVSKMSGQFQELSDKAREMGENTNFSAAEAAEGLTNLAMAGLSAAEQTEALEGTLQLAQAGGLSLAESADIATNVMSGMGMGVDQMDRILNVMAKTASSANTDIRLLGSAFSYAAPVAATMGVSIEETSAAIAILSNAGLKGTIAGNGFASTMLKLAAPTGEAAQAILDAGFSLEEVNPKVVGMQRAFENLKNAGLSDEQTRAIFGLEGIKTATLLMSNATGDKGLAGFTEKFQKSAGSLEEMARRMTDNLSGDIKTMESAFQEAKLKFFKDGGVDTAVRDVIQEITSMLKEMNADGSLKEMGKDFAEIVRFSWACAKALGTIMKTIWEVGDAFATWTNPLHLVEKLLFKHTESMMDQQKHMRELQNITTIYVNTLYEVGKAMKEVDTQSEKQAVVASIDSQIKRYNQMAKEITQRANKEGKVTDAMREQLSAIHSSISGLKEMRANVIAQADEAIRVRLAEEAITKAIELKREAAARAAKAQEVLNAKMLADMDKIAKKLQEKRLSALEDTEEIKIRLRLLKTASWDAMVAEIAALRSKAVDGVASPEDAARLKTLTEGYAKLSDMQDKVREKEVAAAGAEEKFKDELRLIALKLNGSEQQVSAEERRQKVAAKTAALEKEGVKDAAKKAAMLIDAQDEITKKQKEADAQAKKGEGMSVSSTQEIGGGGNVFTGASGMSDEAKTANATEETAANTSRMVEILTSGGGINNPANAPLLSGGAPVDKRFNIGGGATGDVTLLNTVQSCLRELQRLNKINSSGNNQGGQLQITTY